MFANPGSTLLHIFEPTKFLRRTLLSLLCAVLILAQISPAAWAFGVRQLNAQEAICDAEELRSPGSAHIDNHFPNRIQMACECALTLSSDPFVPALPFSSPTDRFDFSAPLYDAAKTFIAARATLYQAACRGPPPFSSPLSASLFFPGFVRVSNYRNLARFRT